ncbi:hypothetical protein MtrunA17_Chr7g0248301 [Medicago truncatula]|uniref:Uncharacterized protein n=1 Tax=Medicago truncatula TaxID=3880 RepID=A0A396H0X7_MEDTR|nr:hypothetical protein MtrunA17_Chr7g0248301 [Medicago truncatula]
MLQPAQASCFLHSLFSHCIPNFVSILPSTSRSIYVREQHIISRIMWLNLEQFSCSKLPEFHLFMNASSI